MDELLRGGLVLPYSENGLIVLIKGQPGTGKTTLALQIAGGACAWEKNKRKKIEVHSYEQDPQDIAAACDRLGIPAHIAPLGYSHEFEPYVSIETDEFSGTTAEIPLDREETPFTWASHLAATLNVGRGDKRRLVVVDGLNILSTEQRRAFEIDKLVSAMRKNSLVGIIVFESIVPMISGIVSQADLLIELRGQEIEGPPRYFLNHLSIIKSRFQQSVLGWHQYKIKKDTGVTIFPSVHYRTHRINLLDDRLKQSQKPLGKLKSEEERKSCKDNKSVLAQLIGIDHLKQGSCTVVLGPRRTWKTQLTLDFLRAGSLVGQPGLLVSLLDNQGTIVEQRPCLCEQYCIGGGCKKHDKCYEQVYLFHFRPGCLAPGEFFHYLERRLNEQADGQKGPISRLAFWDLTQLESRFPLLAADRMFLAGLMDYLKNSEYVDGKIKKSGKEERKKRLITSVFMGAPNKELAEAASEMADNVVFCWQDRHSKQGLGIALYVDRIEGQPGGKKLAFLKVPSKRTITKISDLLRLECNEKELPYAESMIEEIRNLQALPAQKQSLQS